MQTDVANWCWLTLMNYYTLNYSFFVDVNAI
jgi:hypothetical protein